MVAIRGMDEPAILSSVTFSLRDIMTLSAAAAELVLELFWKTRRGHGAEFKQLDDSRHQAMAARTPTLAHGDSRVSGCVSG
ncbi:MAG: hypothetical protein RL701_2727 [Pseudomonadota bacterium]|jgi:hypothetical protein